MMSTARLRELYKQEQNHRKFACVRNDMVKTQLDQYEGFIDKEKQESVQKNQKSIVYTRKHVVRRQVLENCMKSKRDEMKRNHVTTLYGQYNGVGIDEIAGEIDDVIENNHPRHRRRRKIEELFNRGYRKGALLDSKTVHSKVQKYFEKPLVEVHMETKPEVKKAHQQRLPSRTGTFYTGNPTYNKLERHGRDNDEIDHEDRLFVRKKVHRYIEEDIPDDVSTHSDVTNHQKVTSTRVIRPITLPPIKLGTDNTTPAGRPVTDSITNIIARINHANDRREREIKFKKEKRERRILAEKVHGIGHNDLNEADAKRFDKTVPSTKPSKLLNLTAPVYSKSVTNESRYQGRGQSQGNQVTRDVNLTRDTKETDTRISLPPLQVKRSSIAK